MTLAVGTRQTRNSILKKLKSSKFEKLKFLEFSLADLLYDPHDKIEFVYFPETCVISIVTMLSDGRGVEAGIIGKEGMAGAFAAFGEDISPREATIQLAGSGWRMKVEDFREEFDENKDFRCEVLHFVYAFVAQISQNAACICYHRIEQRLARWFLMFDDRAPSETLELTQEFIAQMLGVHRPSVSKNANELQKMGLIKYNRGTVEIIDRQGLENLACECYAEITRNFGHIL